MKILKPIIPFLLILSFSGDLLAQRGISYGALQARANQPLLYIDTILTPGEDSTGADFTVIFRFDYDFLPFKKILPDTKIKTPAGAQYYATARLNAEVFEGKFDRKLDNLVSVNRDFWSDTVFTINFEDTQSSDLYVSGQLTTALDNGMYNYLLHLGLGDLVDDRNSSRQNLIVMDFSKKKRGEVYLIRRVDEADGMQLTLMNMNNNVVFGKDFHALIRIPDYEAGAEYRISMNQVNPGRRDTTVIANVLDLPLEDSDIYTNASLSLMKKADEPSLQLKTGDGPFTYALVNIPNSELESAVYRLTLHKGNEIKPLAAQLVRSYWADMPAALFSLQVSQDMLKFIVPENTLKELKKGSRKEQELKFREFWDERDPTPGTVMNELMAEYYRRVDYAFENFSSPQMPGYDSDQGEVYIKFGPPDNIDRRFPTNGDVIEVWTYGNRTFVFRKTSGFGDFVLVTG
jgi:GWxTD domain-containing protein